MNPAYLSMDSPLGRALLGRRIADEIRIALPNGEQQYSIIQVRYSAV